MSTLKTAAYYADLRHQAAILYIKEGLSTKEITKRLPVSMPTLATWKKADRWDDLRPDENILNECKAAHLYIVEKLTPGEIAMKLSVTTVTVNYWVYKNGWDAARDVHGALNATIQVVSNFCNHFKTLLPKIAAEVEFIQSDYLKTKIPNKTNGHTPLKDRF